MKGSNRRGGRKPSNTQDRSDNFTDFIGNGAYEPSDSEDDYTQQEKMLLDKVRSKSSQSKPPKKLAVMDLPSSDDDDENDAEDEDEYEGGDSGDDVADADSDIEGKEDDFNLPDQRAWGKRRKDYYNADYVDQDYGGFDGEDAAAAELEEQEARDIQRRLAAELDDNDFSLDVFTKSKEDDTLPAKPSEEVIKTDLSQLSSRQKLALLQKECPELLGMITEFRDAMEELKKCLQPAVELVHRKQVSSTQLAQYIRTKYHLVANYVMNMGFYLLLRAQRLPVAAHPVVKRVLQYRQLLQQLEPLDSTVSNQVNELLQANQNGLLPVQGNGVSSKKQTKKSLKLLSVSKAIERGASESSDDSEFESNEKLEVKLRDRESKKKQKMEKSSRIESMKKGAEMPWENTLGSEGEDGLPWATSLGSENEDEANMDVSGINDGSGDEESKRAITWQMAKNKGLTPRRKKEQRNPRVKHRNKFRKAKIRRKGQVRESRTEVERYGGELSGIKKTVSKSVKIK